MSKEQYLKYKQDLLIKDRKESFDGNEFLKKTDEETFANTVLKKYRQEEVESFKKTTSVPVSTIHFSEIKKHTDARNSKLLEALKTLPKGILHHCHLDALVDATFLIEKVINEDTLYLKYREGHDVADFHFYKNGPPKNESGWLKVKEARRQFKGGVEMFDKWLYECFTIVPSKKEDIVFTEFEIWKRFARTFISIRGIFSYVPFTKLYVEEIFNRYSKKDVQQIEVRIPYYVPYNDNGEVRFSDMFSELVDTIENCVTKMKLVKDDYFNLKFIISPTRNSKPYLIKEAMDVTIELYKKYPNYIVGFDMVGHEHEQTLEAHIDNLLDFKERQKKLNIEIPYYFHAGETTGSSTLTDQNLFDAILLDTKRIGHGYSFTRHLSTLSPLVKEKNICFEISPISNQYLGLVKDMANHPIVIFLKNGLPVSISSDDPSLFGYEGFAYDFYMLFMSFESMDIWSLKQLCKNSIEYGSYTPEISKEEIYTIWEKKWKQWITSLIESEQLTTN